MGCCSCVLILVSPLSLLLLSLLSLLAGVRSCCGADSVLDGLLLLKVELEGSGWELLLLALFDAAEEAKARASKSAAVAADCDADTDGCCC